MHVLTRAAMLTSTSAASGPPPMPVNTASRLWMLAIVAGVAEALAASYNLLVNGSATAREVSGLLAVRLVVFVAAYVLVQLTRRGNPWARGTATLVLGTVAMMALALSPVPELATHGVTGFGRPTSVGMVLATTRLVELTAVAAAMVLLFTPRANAYFRK